MSLVLQFGDSNPARAIARANGVHEIADLLAPLGVRFERWSAGVALADDSAQPEILAAYAADIERLRRENGYRSADVVRLKRDSATSDEAWAEKARAARSKFLEEHTHAEDEVRFFVEGSGMFCLHIDGKVTQIVCERGDLLSVPAGTRHWFDMGEEPAFCAIRLFGNESGWAAAFTGDKLASRFPSYDQVRRTYL
jgi:1,2-dihydroxy-3-keto-5-methylthiopentene dioxygenase